MNIFRKNTVIIWVLAGLLVASLSTLGTLAYHRYLKQCRQKEVKECSMQCNLLTEELGLSESQAKVIDRIRSGHRQAAMAASDSLRFTRSELVTELGRDLPDTLRLRQLAQRIGSLQEQLTNLTIDQYFRIRNECNPAQQEKLSSLYYELMGCCAAGEGGKMREECRQRP